MNFQDILQKAGVDIYSKENEKVLWKVMDEAEKLGIEAFNTGGYTGSWGPEGKWAMLHEKEIVLNKQDTKNFLNAISMLREISDIIDLQAMSYSNLFNNYTPTLQNMSNTLQQEVTIHAEFPNVVEHNEIQLALEGLVNSASQHANRK